MGMANVLSLAGGLTPAAALGGCCGGSLNSGLAAGAGISTGVGSMSVGMNAGASLDSAEHYISNSSLAMVIGSAGRGGSSGGGGSGNPGLSGRRLGVGGGMGGGVDGFSNGLKGDAKNTSNSVGLVAHVLASGVGGGPNTSQAGALSRGSANGMGSAIGSSNSLDVLANSCANNEPPLPQRLQHTGKSGPPRVVSGVPVEGHPEWSAYAAPDGRTYYYNATSGVSSWDKPPDPGGVEAGAVSPVAALPSSAVGSSHGSSNDLNPLGRSSAASSTADISALADAATAISLN